jgi:hypothetical protein
MLVLIRSIEGILAALLLGLGWATWRQRHRLGQPRPLLWVTARLFLALWLILLGVAVESFLLPGNLWSPLYSLHSVCIYLSFPAGFLVGWWRNSPGVRSLVPFFDSLVLGTLAGALMMAVNLGVLVAVSNYPDWLSWKWDAALEEFFSLLGVFGAAQGFIGALLGAILGAWGKERLRQSTMSSASAP